MRTFKRWELTDNSTIAPLISGPRRGIYVLEFSDGTQYVGQSVDVVTRYATHRHGSNHHDAWEDAVAVSFMPIERGNMDLAENIEIEMRDSSGIKLRNKAGNPFHTQPTLFDQVVSAEDQRHWANGHAQYGWLGPTPDNVGKSKFLKLCERQETMRVYEAITKDLKFLIENVIPNPADTELKYWVLSDLPGTARYATLNAGAQEIAFFPRSKTSRRGLEGRGQISDLRVRINMLPAFSGNQPDRPRPIRQIATTGNMTFIDRSRPSKRYRGSHGWKRTANGTRYRMDEINGYAIASVDSLYLPVGHTEEVLTDDPSYLERVRRLALALMRSRGSSHLYRSHSPALVSEIFGE